MFQNWYPQFRKVTFKSEIISLPESFVKYLSEDGIYMPATAFPKYEKNDESTYYEDTNWEDESGDAEEVANSPNFPELEAKIKETIEKFEGAVFPKLNWSCPKDASWMSSTGDLKCQNAYDIFLLLKSSDFINHDLSQELAKDKYVLVLRKWYELNVAMEFRCFVKNRKLIGISQRDYTTFYKFIVESKASLEEKIITFFKTEISGKFPSPDYTFDVYITKQGRVWLVDFNPWIDATEPLLFDWEELNENYEETETKDETEETKEGKKEDIEEIEEYPEFRIVETQGNIRPTLAMTNRLPADLVDLSDASAIAELCRNFGNNTNIPSP